MFRMESNDTDGLISHTLDFITSPSTSYLTNLIDESKQMEPDPARPSTLEIFSNNLLYNTLKFLGLVSIPIFIFLIPVGLYRLYKTKNVNLAYLIIFSIFMIIPAMYAYGRDIQETKYLLILFPIFCTFSVYGLDMFKKLEQNKFILLLFLIILISSILLLNYNQPNNVYYNEIYEVTKYVVKNASGVNTYPGNSFVKIVTLENNWPKSLPIGDDDKVTFNIKKIPSKNFTTLEEYILHSEINDLSHIVLVEENNNSSFLDDLFYNYKKYPYLEKVFDSSNKNFTNKIIILEINYPIFEKMSL